MRKVKNRYKAERETRHGILSRVFDTKEEAKEFEEAPNDEIQTIIEGCTFVGAQYDAKAVQAIERIAQGLVENATSLGKLADVLRSSNVDIDCMIKIDSAQ